jgi:hypothetical protein
MSRPPIQLDLFNQPTLNIAKAIKTAMAEDMHNSGLSREQIIDRMNDLSSRYGVCLTHGNCKRLTIETFEKWLNPTDLSRLIPLKAVPVFCAATKGCKIVDALARPLGLRVIDETDQKKLMWAEAKLDVKHANRKIRALESQL